MLVMFEEIHGTNTHPVAVNTDKILYVEPRGDHLTHIQFGDREYCTVKGAYRDVVMKINRKMVEDDDLE